MKKPLLLGGFFLAMFLCAPLQAQIVGNPAPPTLVFEDLPAKSSGKVDPALVELKSEFEQGARLKSGRSGFESDNPLLQIVDGRIVVDIVSQTTDVEGLKKTLEAAGMKVTGTFGRVISGILPIESIDKLNTIATLRYAKPALKPSTNVGIVTSQGDSAMRSSVIKKKLGIDGLGVKIGVLSDSYNNLGGEATGVAQGDLPGPANPNYYRTPVQVIEDLPSGGSDEGRAMLELIHDVAPGSHLAFHTAFTGQAGFANGIIKLANAGCNTIVDDVIYFAEPFFQDGIIAQAADIVNQNGVNYFSSAGNQGRASYESPYRASTVESLGAGNGTAHNFSNPWETARYTQPIFIPTGGRFVCSFQWDDSFFSASGVPAQTDMDIYLLNSVGQVVAGGASDNLASGDPVEVFAYTNPSASSQTFFIVILKYAGPDPTRLKYVNFGSGQFFLTTPSIPGILSSTLVGHANADGAIAVGASAYFNTPEFGVNPAVINGFSALAGTPILRTKTGQRTYTVRTKPELVGPDGANTSFFSADAAQDDDAFPNFFGTSAAAPHVAAVTALMREAHRQPYLVPQTYKGVLINTARDMDDPNTPQFDFGFDYRTGFGLVNAEAAVKTLSWTPAYIQNLKLTSVCSDNPDSVRRWRVTNPNSFEIRVTWEVYKTDQKGYLIARPGETFFFTDALPGPNTTIISWVDEKGKTKKNTKASNDADCKGARTGDGLIASTDSFEMLTAYPNPSEGKFNLLFLGNENRQPIHVKMFDAKGQQVYNRQHAVEDNNSQISIEANSLPDGLYLLQATQGAKTQSIKIIKR
jgi:hypothetical protein